MDKLQNTDKDIFLERVETNTNIFYIDRQRNIFNNNSILEKFENYNQIIKKQKMEAQHLVPVQSELIKEIYSQGLKKLFENFEGKKVGEDFSLEDALKVIMDENIQPMQKEENVPKVEKVEKVEKVKKPRKTSGYNVFCIENKSKILDKVKELQETSPDKKIRWLSAAGALWKELSSENKNTYEEKAKKCKEVS